MKGLLVILIIHVILVENFLSISEYESCDGEHCGSVISMPIMDNMKASLKADLDVSKMNEHLKAYIEQEIKKGVKTAMESMMQQLIENRTEQMNSEITEKFIDAEERHTVKMDHMELLIKNKSEEMLKSFKDNDYKSKASFDVKMEEFNHQFERKDRVKYAFFSHLSSDRIALSKETIVVYDIVPLNIGSVYDRTTGMFTCKEDGIYIFSWTSVSQPKEEFTSAFVVDGIPKACNVVDNEATDDHLSGSTSIIVKMRKGQRAWIKAVGPDGDYLEASWLSIPSSVFSGFKI